jgi:hypothetical protein
MAYTHLARGSGNNFGGPPPTPEKLFSSPRRTNNLPFLHVSQDTRRSQRRCLFAHRHEECDYPPLDHQDTEERCHSECWSRLLDCLSQALDGETGSENITQLVDW